MYPVIQGGEVAHFPFEEGDLPCESISLDASHRQGDGDDLLDEVCGRGIMHNLPVQQACIVSELENTILRSAGRALRCRQ
jgi:hypothetical protein